MSTVTLDGFAFPEGVIWPDRYDFTPIQTAKAFALDGSLILENNIKLAGMPITIKTERLADGWCGLFTKAQVDGLLSLYNDVTDPERTLTIGGASYLVRFDRSENGVQVDHLAISAATEQWTEQVYSVTARFITMTI